MSFSWIRNTGISRKEKDRMPPHISHSRMVLHQLSTLHLLLLPDGCSFLLPFCHLSAIDAFCLSLVVWSSAFPLLFCLLFLFNGWTRANRSLLSTKSFETSWSIGPVGLAPLNFQSLWKSSPSGHRSQDSRLTNCRCEAVASKLLGPVL